MLIVPDDAPAPDSIEYNNYLIDKLEEILLYTAGRMLVLFTSFETMNQVAKKIANLLGRMGIKPSCSVSRMRS